MKEFTIGKNDAGQRLDRWLAKNLPLLPAPLAQKYIRLKRVKVNGKGAKRDARLTRGDVLQLYINDEFFETPAPENAFLSLYKPNLHILFENEHILLVDKRPGLVVHPDEQEKVNTPPGSGRSPRRCAIGSTGTREASSLRPRPPRACGS